MPSPADRSADAVTAAVRHPVDRGRYGECMPFGSRRVGRGIVQAMRRAARQSIRQEQAKRRREERQQREEEGDDDSPSHRRAGTAGRGGEHAAYPGDFTGVPDLGYAPHADDVADPGEVVWTWVPYEEDHEQGKDRPVLVIGRDAGWLLALQLTSKDHDRDEGQERRAGRLWMDIGTGGWDRAGRPSEVRLNRIIRVDPAAVRRIGAVLDRDRFDQVAGAVRAAR